MAPAERCAVLVGGLLWEGGVLPPAGSRIPSEAVALEALALELAGAADGFRLFPGLAFGGFLVGTP